MEICGIAAPPGIAKNRFMVVILRLPCYNKGVGLEHKDTCRLAVRRGKP